MPVWCWWSIAGASMSRRRRLGRPRPRTRSPLRRANGTGLGAAGMPASRVLRVRFGLVPSGGRCALGPGTTLGAHRREVGRTLRTVAWRAPSRICWPPRPSRLRTRPALERSRLRPADRVARTGIDGRGPPQIDRQGLLSLKGGTEPPYPAGCRRAVCLVPPGSPHMVASGGEDV